MATKIKTCCLFKQKHCLVFCLFIFEKDFTLKYVYQLHYTFLLLYTVCTKKNIQKITCMVDGKGGLIRRQ